MADGNDEEYQESPWIRVDLGDAPEVIFLDSHCDAMEVELALMVGESA